MTARSLDRILRTACTIADLDGDDQVDAGAVLEAAAFRAFESDRLADPRAFETRIRRPPALPEAPSA
jgi:hypothetical protein